MKKRLYNVNVDLLDKEEVFSKINCFIYTGRIHTLSFLNAHCFNIAQRNTAYRKAINRSDLLLNDGIGIKMACMLNGIKPKENLNGTDLIPEILQFASNKDTPVFFLGGEPGIAERAKQNMLKKIPELNVSGVHSGFFTPDEEPALIKHINNSGAGILILGMGVPKQELWMDGNARKLKNMKLIVSGGAILDFMAGKYPRAPKYIRELGFEWLFRLIKEPRRLANRYIIGNMVFLKTIFLLKLKKQNTNLFI